MQTEEAAYKLIVRYTGKRLVERTIVLRGKITLANVLQVRDSYKADPEVLSVDLVRTRKPKTYNYNHYETPVMVDDSGTVTTEAEQSLMFKAAAKQQVAASARTDAEKAEWARTNRFDNRTCTWH